MTSSLSQARGTAHKPSLVSRRKFLGNMGALGASLLLLPGCKRIDTLAQLAPQTYVVEMIDNFYDPIGLNINRGDTVIWVEPPELILSRHTATAYHPDYDKKLRIPEEAPAWNSGFLEEVGDSWGHTFETVGLHDYFCIPHETDGMVGRILVEEATGPGTQPLSVGMSPAGQSVIPFVEELENHIGEVFNFQGRINAATLPWRQGDQAEALQRWDVLLAESETYFPQFYERLGESDIHQIQEQITAFDAVMKSTDSVFVALDAANDLKGFLESLVYTV